MRIEFKNFSVILIVILFGCGENKEVDSEIKSLSAAEQRLCDSLKFREQFVDIIKVHTRQPITLIPKVNERGELTDSTGFGLCSKCEMEKARPFVLAYKEKFRQESCLIFIFSDDGSGRDYVGLIHGRNEIELLRWRKTNGMDQAYKNENLVNKFNEWKQKEDFYIVSAGRNYVEIEFKGPVRNAEKFAAEAYSFCPGLIEDENHITDLILKLKTENALRFQWD